MLKSISKHGLMKNFLCSFTVFFCVSAIFSASALDAREPRDLYAFLKKPIGLSDKEIQGLKFDKVIVKTLDVRAEHELVILGVARVKAPMAFCVEQYGKEGMSIDLAAVEAKEDFSEPPRLEDTQNLSLSQTDIKALMKCKPGDCKMKVPQTAFDKIARLRDKTDSDGSTENAIFREGVLEYVKAYLKDGNDALVEYYDKNPPLKLVDEFKELLKQAEYLYAYIPELHNYLENFPRAELPNAKNVFYWKKEIFGKDADLPVISINHLVLLQRPEAVPKIVAATKQLYATHYFEAAFEITALEMDPEAPQSNTYLICVSRARLDIMRKLPGFLKKALSKGANDLFHKKTRIVKTNLEAAYLSESSNHP